MQVIIRALEPSDFDSLTKYYYEFYDEVKENDSFGLVLFDEKPSLLDEMNWFLGFQKAIEEGNAVALVAEADGKIVGFCEVDRRKPKSPVSHRGDFGVSVKREYRGKGIGAMLLREMIRKCKSKFETLELEVLAENQVARRLYEKFGFKEYGLRPQSIKRNGKYFDEVLMYLRL